MPIHLARVHRAPLAHELEEQMRALPAPGGQRDTSPRGCISASTALDTKP
jgi:hypothetical protein